jgi:tetraacyldisaccharide 4'-kinase
MSRPFLPRKLLLPLVPAYRLALWLREKRLGHQSGAGAAAALSGGQHRQPFHRRRGQNAFDHCAGQGAERARLARGCALPRLWTKRAVNRARVAPAATAEEFGDEPLLIAREAGVPVYVADSALRCGLLAEGDAAAIAVLT